MIKEKKCKGQNKAHGFESCGKMTNVSYLKYGLCASCYPKFLLNDERGKIIMHNAMLKGNGIVKTKIAKESKKQTRDEKDKLKDWSAELQKKVNHIVRLIDKGLPCLATKIYAKKFDAGHVYARGGNKTIRFNLHNIHRQSAQSNHYQNDDGLLREGVVREYGQPYMTFISELRRTPALKYSNKEYHEFYKKACKIVLRLQKEDKEYLDWERLAKRDLINTELGIYDVEFCFHQSPF